jgi:hypothetical protein
MDSILTKALLDTDEHGFKKKIYFACGEGKLVANLHLSISGFDTAARRREESVCIRENQCPKS